MDLGVSLPGKELGTDAVKLRDFVQGAEALGYTHVSVGEHVIGADITHRPGWDLPHTIEGFMRDPFTTLAFIAGQTQQMLLVMSVMILPQHPTVLVAKQAADIDCLSGGRLRLGVGVGRYSLEYEAVNKEYKNRGQRIIEQCALLRALWTQEVVTFEGKWERLDQMGINPLPVQRPIPIWFGGGGVDTVLKRIAEHADGWIITPLAIEGGVPGGVGRYKEYLRAAGKGPDSMPIYYGSRANSGTPDEWREYHETMRGLGLTALSVSTTGLGESPDAHLAALRAYQEAVE